MPGAVRLELDREIVRHRLSHRARYYDLLREDPRFSPWIGLHRGAPGEKRLDRYIREVLTNQPRKLRESGGPADHPLPPPPPPSGHQPASPAQGPQVDVLTGGAPAVSYEELQAHLRRTLAILGPAMAALINEYGEVTNPALFAKLNQQHLATLEAMARYTKRFHEDLNSEAFVERVLERVLLEIPDDDRARTQALQDDINNIFRECGGLAAKGA